MTARGDTIRKFIIQTIRETPKEVLARTSEEFAITRQAVSRYITGLIKDGAISASGHTRSRTYDLVIEVNDFNFRLEDGLEEDVIWRENIRPLVEDRLPKHIYDICQYGFTEMVNNAIDHSEGRMLSVVVLQTLIDIQFLIIDDGVGIFTKIKRAFKLDDTMHALLELSKGKLTTDPSRHSGQGIFFTSRVFDDFSIISGSLCFIHRANRNDWLLENETSGREGTGIIMTIDISTPRTLKQTFDQFSSGDEDYGFDKTCVPVTLARYGDDNLISRSQAKRLMGRVECFGTVMLDFNNVHTVGQAFADEIFRVFQQDHPEIELHIINANDDVKRMIRRARAQLNAKNEGTE